MRTKWFMLGAISSGVVAVYSTLYILALVEENSKGVSGAITNSILGEPKKFKTPGMTTEYR